MNTQILITGQQISFTTVGNKRLVDGAHHFKVVEINDIFMWLASRKTDGSYSGRYLFSKIELAKLMNCQQIHR